jgi:hypothetical protein
MAQCCGMLTGWLRHGSDRPPRSRDSWPSSRWTRSSGAHSSAKPSLSGYATTGPGVADAGHPSLEAMRHSEGLIEFATLGSGNHFIELQSDEEGRLWPMGPQWIPRDGCSHPRSPSGSRRGRWRRAPSAGNVHHTLVLVCGVNAGEAVSIVVPTAGQD